MNIVAWAYDESELEKFSSVGVSTVLLETPFTRNKSTEYNEERFLNLIQQAKALGLSVYLSFNTMIHERMIESITKFIDFVKERSIDGFVVFDFTLYQILKKVQLESKMIYQPGTLTTNYFDPYFCKVHNLKGITISKEITLHQMLEIMMVTDGIEYSYVGHGFLEMFYSRRPLIQDYYMFKGWEPLNVLNHKEYYLIEQLRENEPYPIVEDDFGTTIFRSNKLISFNELGVLKPYLTDFFIERFHLSFEEYTDAIEAYINPKLQKTYLDKYPLHIDSGFYYREIGSKKEGEL